MEGFYKYENGTLAFASIGIYKPNMTYLVSQHTTYTYPIDGWYYCSSFNNALEFFGLELKEDGDLQELPVKIWQVKELVSKYVLKSDITADEYERLISIYPEWQPDEDLTDILGNVIVRVYDGKLYEIIQGHITQTGWEPPLVPALWKEVPPPNVIPEWVQPLGSEDAYPLGAKVTHNRKTWESTVDNNVWEPGVYGWIEI